MPHSLYTSTGIRRLHGRQSIQRLLLFTLASICTHCHHPPPQSLQVFSHQSSLKHQHQTRTFLYYTPPKKVAKPALLFVFHSSNSTASEIRSQFGYRLDHRASTDGTIVVYPQGFQKHWNDCRKQAPYSAKKKNIDDVGFVNAMIAFFQIWQTCQAIWDF